ncbi:response regulator [Silvimonas amylolytica]|uniref:histidine kinase n=1 Tax=Silvimonas amylolytica TaxID=449663 RepID=A0ABQ2PLA7_9NEIS|nr:response regulator [Silvimonas amylolytica]GGP26073.1 hypothetical protein GCM10010971_18920 [Silvimonas amylolytica]
MSKPVAAHPLTAATPARILQIEDNPLDAELSQITLERAGFRARFTLVDTEQRMRDALAGQPFDLILSDFLLPLFSGATALDIAQTLCPQTPFIFVSGVSGEETAVEMMRRGATDYVLKQRLGLLPKSVERALTLVREQTRRQQVEAALKTSQINVRLATEAGKLGMWDYRPLTGELIWDLRCREMFGIGPDDQVDLALYTRCVHPDDRERMGQVIAQCTHSPQFSECNADYRIVLPDGRIRWVNTLGKSFFENGRCIQFLGVLLDVTERQLAREAISQQNVVLEERVAARTQERDRVWALSHDMLAVMRADLTPITLNPAWADALGWPLSDLLAGSLGRYIDEADLEATLAALQQPQQDETAVRFETRFRCANGEERWLAWTAVNADGLHYCIARDVTADKARLEELATANCELIKQIHQRQRMEATMQKMQRLEAVGQLTAGVAHDFNNLLTVVLSNATFLEHDLRSITLADKTRQRLANIRNAGQRGGKLTSQLLTFSRQQQLAPRAANLNQTVEAMLELLRSTIGGSVQVITGLEPDLWTAMVDTTQIEMVILNLAINARDAMDGGGTLYINTANAQFAQEDNGAGAPGAGDFVRLTVRDSGHGMSPDVLARAFEPFFTTKEVGKGSGLGLAQVYGFARQSGGGVTIETKENEGTSVNVYLPRLAHPVAEPQAPCDQPTIAVGNDSITLLVVDDDEAVGELTAAHLADLGYRVERATSGKSALALLAAHPQINALVADFAMPEMNGAELAMAARTLRPDLPVVFVTGYIELGKLDLPHSGIVQKPYSVEQLADMVRQQLNQVPALTPDTAAPLQ